MSSLHIPVFASVVEHRTPDRKAWVRARCHQIPSECTRSTCSLNQWVRSLVGLFTSAGTGEYFPPLQFTCRNCGGGDRGRVAIYRPFGEVSLSLNRTVTCMVLKANDRRTSCPCHDEFRGPRSDYVRQAAILDSIPTTANAARRNYPRYQISSLFFLPLFLIFGDSFHYLPPMDPLCSKLAIGRRKKMMVAWFGKPGFILTERHHGTSTTLL
ncbi:uncharacterized protein TNCV_4057291 [Trichonephila clavipes]|nr:uncharacterized protein TNCV_4057291 [Trichonephila clavipes]